MNGNHLAVIPTIDELLSDATKAATLPPDIARTMLAGLAGLLPVLIAQSARDTGKAETPAPEKWLTVEQVVSQFGVTERWLFRHKRHLPYSQPTRKTLLFHEERLRRWFASRKAN